MKVDLAIFGDSDREQAQGLASMWRDRYVSDDELAAAMAQASAKVKRLALDLLTPAEVGMC